MKIFSSSIKVLLLFILFINVLLISNGGFLKNVEAHTIYPNNRISSGQAFSLYLKQDGTVWSWGDNSNYQLGNSSAGSQSAKPVQVSGLSGIIAVSAGDYQAMALKSDGSVWRWGGTGMGNPVQIPQLTNIISISSGISHFLALKSDGTVWAWGKNSDGQLGNGIRSGTVTTTPVSIPGLGGVIAIGAGANYSAALKSDGKVFTWGSNDSGQLGLNITMGSYTTTPTQVPNLTGVTSISVGKWHMFATKSTGIIMGWGRNSEGELLINDTINKNIPQQLTDTSIISVLAGRLNSFGINKYGEMLAWGVDSSGQLGVGSSTHNTILTPKRIYLPSSRVFESTNIIAIASGGVFTIALTSDDSIFGWGDNYYSQLATNNNYLFPTNNPVDEIIIADFPTILPSTTIITDQNIMARIIYPYAAPGQLKQYRTNSGPWVDYSNSIELTSNVTIDARLSGSSSFTTLNIANIDKVVPSIPINVISPNKTSTSIDLAWSNSTDDVGVSGYDIYSGTTLIGTAPSNSYSVTDITYNVYGPSQTSMYSIVAKDAFGHRSKASDYLIVTANPDSPEADDTISGAIPIKLDTTYSAYINSSTDLDYYKFVSDKDGIDKVTLKVPTDKNYDVYIYDSNDEIIATGMRKSGVNETVVFEVATGSTYYIKVVGVNGDVGTMPYSLRLTKTLLNYKTDYQYDTNGNLKNKNTIVTK